MNTVIFISLTSEYFSFVKFIKKVITTRYIKIRYFFKVVMTTLIRAVQPMLAHGALKHYQRLLGQPMLQLQFAAEMLKPCD